jgi:hypothetical protein
VTTQNQRADRRRRGRTIAAALILVAWLGGLGILVGREFFRERSVIIAEAAMRLGPSATYFVVEQGGRQIGYASTTIDTTGTTFDVIDYFIADLPIAGRSFRASARSVITMSRALALRRFDVQIDIPDAPMSAAGAVEGDSAVRFVLRIPGQPSDTQRVAVRGPILVPTMLPATAMLIGSPSVGKSITLPSFDPRTMAASEVTFRIAAESLFTVTDSARFDAASNLFVSANEDTVRAWKLEPTDGGGFSGWVDAQGNVVLAQQPGGITLRRMAYEIAFENWRRTRGESAAAGGSSLGDLLEGTAIAADAMPGNRTINALRVRLTGTSLAGFDLAGGRQRLRGDTLEVGVEPSSALTADWSLATRDRAFRDRYRTYLQEEPLLQVNNREIAGLAVRIAGSERDPRVVAERINRWVHDSLAKEITLTVPSALQVLRTRRGDCNEHTQLYVALARAAGIPARIATGLAYVNGKFYYHAWPEVRLGDWVAVDPTFGQFPADAAHLRFVSGGLTRQGELLRLVGTLQVEVLDAR